IGLGENLTPRVGYRRELNAEGPGLVHDGTEFDLLKFRLFGSVVEIMGIQLGYSIGRAVGEGASFGDCAELLVDLFLGTDEEDHPLADPPLVRLRSLQGEALQVAIE